MTQVLITGASRGVGRATAILCAQRGADLILLGRSSAAMMLVQDEMRAFGVSTSFYEVDFESRSQLDTALAQMEKDGISPDVIIHNAGIVERANVAKMEDGVWDRHLEINVTAPFRLTRALLPQMLKKGEGRILFVSSISAALATPRQSAYNASKAALTMMMRCLALEISDTGVSTMALLPGTVDTEMLKGSGYAPRMTADEVARTLVFHALDASPAHNGALVEMFGT